MEKRKLLSILLATACVCSLAMPVQPGGSYSPATVYAADSNETESVNVALQEKGGKVSASSVREQDAFNFSKENVNDGNTETEWQAETEDGYNWEPGEWVSVKFDKEYSVNNVELLFRSDKYIPTSYKIEYAGACEEGTEPVWKEWHVQESSDAHRAVHQLQPVNAQYVKITITGGVAAIMELRVFTGTELDTSTGVDFKLNNSEYTISVGDSVCVSPIYENLSDKKSAAEYTYTSSDAAVASVDAYGVITAKTSGTAIITAKASDGATAQSVVTVNQPCTTFYYVATDGNNANPGTAEAPFATIEGARDAIRKLETIPDGGVTVYLRGGEYYVDETIVFTPEDSGEEGKPIVYASYPGEEATIHSGKEITGFEKLTGDYPMGLPESAKGHVYVADVEPGWRFHDLYVNGTERQQIARQFNSDDWDTWAHFPVMTEGPIAQRQRLGDAFDTMQVQMNPEHLKDVPGNGDVEMYILPVNWWNCLAILKNIDAEAGTAYIESYNPSISPVEWIEKNGQVFVPDGGRYNIMNAAKYLDEPGEWCIDSEKGKVYWWPEYASDLDSVIAPYAYELIRLQGDDEDKNWENKVEYIEFRGLNFMYTDRLPENQWADNKWDPDLVVRNSENTDAAIFMQNVENCAVVDSTICCTGTYAVALDHYAKNNRVVQNEMYDLGCGGVQIYGYGPGTKTTMHNTHNVVLANYIHHIGLAPYQHSSAVTIFGAGHNNVKFNKVEHVPYASMMVVGTMAESMNPEIFGFGKDRSAYVDTYGNANTQYGVRQEDFRQYVEEHPELDPSFFNSRWQNGRNVMEFQGSEYNIFEYNITNEYMEVMNDGGCYYAWSTGKNNEYNYNIAYMTGSAKGMCYPLYMDDFVNYLKLEGNRVWASQTGHIDKSQGTNIWKDSVSSATKPEGYDALLDTIEGVVEGLGGYKDSATTVEREPAPEMEGLLVEVCEENSNKTTITMPSLPQGAVSFVYAPVNKEVENPSMGQFVSASKELQENTENDIPAYTGEKFIIYAIDKDGGVVAYARFTAQTSNEPKSLMKEDFEDDKLEGTWVIKKEGTQGDTDSINREEMDGSTAWVSDSRMEQIIINNNQADWRDYYVEMEFKLDGWQTPSIWGDAASGIMIGGYVAGSDGDPNNYQFVFRKSGSVEVLKRMNQAFHTLVSGVNYTVETDMWYKMKIDFEGSTIRCYIAPKDEAYGEPLVDWTDDGTKAGTPLTYGGLTLQLIDADVAIDNLNVYGIESPGDFIYEIYHPEAIEVKEGTSIQDIALPDTVKVKLYSGEIVDCAVKWDTTVYTAEEGTYVLPGTLTLPEIVENVDNETAELTISVTGTAEAPDYDVELPQNIQNGTITADKLKAEAGETVTLMVKADDGYMLKEGSLKVNNGAVEVTAGENGTYTFEMPKGGAIITAEFVKKDVEYPGENPGENPGEDQKNPDKQKLSALIAEVDKLDLSKYTAESVKTLKEALAKAKAVMADNSLTAEDQQQVDEAVKLLQEAKDGLKLKDAGDAGKAPTDDKGDVPTPGKTGDESQLLLWLILMALAASCAGVVVIKRRQSGM